MSHGKLHCNMPPTPLAGTVIAVLTSHLVITTCLQDGDKKVHEISAFNPQNIEIKLKSVWLTSVCYIILLRYYWFHRMLPGNFFLGSLAGCFFIDRSVKCQKEKHLVIKIPVYFIWSSHYIYLLCWTSATHHWPLVCALATTEYLS